ncbi:stage IV sporulation protein FB [Geomicrobium halophilum]|uniref:Stage IV sporulation protein FB n=1 Tax=Geomicrobium halophilum TaxID=549000 RepID=A0A841PKY7_9BACL|nr:M50 family metallopeptidase [Geomicrobium halophilum]MBB6448354.1 stage IV sporulation protein FB [Geomicrobium halophilum]
MISLLLLVRVHPLFWFVIALGVATGYFRELLILFFIVCCHELGHAMAAKYFGWRLRKIELLPFGGVAETEEYGNRPYHEELIVILAGPFQHLVLIALSWIALMLFPFWTTSDHNLFLFHNSALLLFNLLPIWPLDGGKLLQLVACKIWPFREAQRWTLRLSLMFLAIAAVFTAAWYPLHLQWWMILVFLAIAHYIEWRQQPYGFVRFILERRLLQKKDKEKAVITSVPSKESVHVALRRLHKGKVTVYKIMESGHFIEEADLIEYWFHTREGQVSIGTFTKG